MSEQEHVAIESLSVGSTGPAKGGAGLENGLASAHTSTIRIGPNQ